MEETEKKKIGVLVGGSGLIGGTLTHYFKTQTAGRIDIRAPNSKKLSIRNLDDIIEYMRRVRPDFIINAAMASIGSDAQLACEVNYLGGVNLARAALSLNIPYITFSSAAVLPSGEDLTEDDRNVLAPHLSNYAKSKLLTEQTLRAMHENHGLDYTLIRLAIVYGEHDHKIQGLQRLFYSLLNETMPVMLTKRGVRHSYTNCNKLPSFVHHVLGHREEFGGQTYHFVDPEPVELVDLICTIKAALNLKRPRQIFVPYAVTRFMKAYLVWTLRILSYIGIDGNLPPELLFLEHFYKSQTLSAAKLKASSYVDPAPGATIYLALAGILDYYRTRWTHLNLLARHQNTFSFLDERGRMFHEKPEALGNQVADSCGALSALNGGLFGTQTAGDLD